MFAMAECDSSQPRVLMVGIDSAELSLIERWIDEERLPNLAALRRRGAFGRMTSTAELNASPWPSFYTGMNPGDHGYHNFLMWRAETMRYARPDGTWLPVTPFWRDLSAQGPRVIALDVPDTFPGEPFNGIELGNWASHYRMSPPYTLPRERMKQINRRFGHAPMPLERAGLMNADELLAVRDSLIEITETQTRLGEELIATEPWDLFLMVYGTSHRAGHHLWSDTSAAGPVPPQKRAEFDRMLFDVYAACDKGLGRLLKHVDEQTHVIVFACHGMTDNRALTDLLPEMVRRVVEDDDGRAAESTPETKPSLSKRLRRCIPLSWRSAIKDRLPQDWQDWLTIFWRAGGEDWSQTPVFCTFGDLQGHIRVNLVGRERNGIVQPGEAYERWLDKVTEGLMTFVDEQTGEPIVKTIKRPDELYPDGEMNRFLPDLIVYWRQRVAAAFTGMTSPRYGRIPSPLDGKAPDGRSGHHDYDGWLLAAGPDIDAGSAFEHVHELDLAPTLHAMFDVPAPPHFRGKAIEELVAFKTAVARAAK